MTKRGLAVELYFDHTSTKRIVSLWSQDELCSSRPQGDPHISLAVFSPVAVEPLQEAIEKLARETSRFTVRLSAVGSFPSSEGVVFLIPVITNELLATHLRFFELLRSTGIEASPYYYSGFWVPHVTVGLDIEKTEVSSVLEFWRNKNVYEEVTIEEVGLVEFRPVKTIYRLPLTDSATV